MPRAELERYCELIAALKLRTTNKNGRHLSTRRAIELLEDYGVETTEGLVQAPKGLLTRPTVNRYLTLWRLDQPRLTREPAAVRFQAEHSNDCWQFDILPSDLKHIDKPDWIDPAKGQPMLALFSVVDDRSGTAYQEYRCIYGEDAESALRFLFNAMAPKADAAYPFQGRPQMLYLDNGPVAKSRVFQNVMQALGIEWQTHLPAGKDGTRTTARSKGKVERPFRTVKEAHETLYHFHKPETEQQANEWLLRYLLNYNAQRHRSEPHSRIDDWLTHLPAEGLREMCTWEQFCRFAREPERRKVGIDARLSIEGTQYEVEPAMAGESVVFKPTMEEIGYRTDVFSLDGIAGHQHEYIQWLLKTCSEGHSETDPMLTDDALDLLAAKLRTPLQIQLHLTLALEAGYQAGEKPVPVEVVESILSRHIDDLEPTLTRHGYRIKDLTEQLDAKSADIKALFNNTLDPVRATELREKMLRAGLPI